MSTPDTNYKDKVDMNYNFNVHINRCMDMSRNPMFFPDAVELLALALPLSPKLAVIKRRQDWNPIVEDFEYTYAGPIKIGSKTKPLMQKIGKSHNRYPIPYIEDEEGNKVIDWSDPHIISPKLVTKEVPDYTEYFGIILEEAENAGLTWNQDLTTAVRENTNPPFDKAPRPYLRGKKREEPESEPGL